MSPPPPSQGHQSCFTSFPPPSTSAVPAAAGAGSNPRALVPSPSYPSPFHIQSSTTHQGICPKQDVTEATSVRHCPGTAMPSLPWVSPPRPTFPCPFSCRWSLWQRGARQAALPPGWACPWRGWKWVEISRFPDFHLGPRQELHTHGQRWEPRWGCLQCPQGVARLDKALAFGLVTLQAPWMELVLLQCQPCPQWVRCPCCHQSRCRLGSPSGGL